MKFRQKIEDFWWYQPPEVVGLAGDNGIVYVDIGHAWCIATEKHKGIPTGSLILRCSCGELMQASFIAVHTRFKLLGCHHKALPKK